MCFADTTEQLRKDTLKENPIPVIDFSKLGLNVSQNACDEDSLKTVGSQIRDAFSKSGFCYLTNYGIQQTEIDHFMEVSKQFFYQTTEEKNKCVRGTERNFGWVAVEREHLNPERPGDLKEAFNYCPSDDLNNWPTPEF
ncbi:hypothetical protein DPMN_115607 [Dreissena polymorpha]|uniref:Non-haem dioxygenase N-terminal domain-containing protein n=1 Tax=Dreissena polymorpha TaxID=45954 RepID=A0A9D4KMC6_DREPO|nr:hypothetical protein DPMN_115607 [Dreissena polymorpha]